MPLLRFTVDINGSRETIFELIADLAHYERWLPGSRTFGGMTRVSPALPGVGTTSAVLQCLKLHRRTLVLSQRRFIMINEPDKSELNYEGYWSSRPLNELLAKAQEFVGKAYSGTMSTMAFLEWSLDRTEQGSEEGADIADAMEKASRINKMLGKLRQDVEKLNQRYGAS